MGMNPDRAHHPLAQPPPPCYIADQHNAGADMPDDPLEGKDPRNGYFAPGNRFWEARSSCGPKPLFTDPDDLWQACTEYFQWNQDNPLIEGKLVSFQGVTTLEELPKMRAMTISGLCGFLDIRVATWSDWRKSRPDLLDVIEKVDAIIFRQKFEGAAADLLNGSLIARELGLADKQDHTTNGKDMPASQPVDAGLVSALVAKLTD